MDTEKGYLKEKVKHLIAVYGYTKSTAEHIAVRHWKARQTQLRKAQKKIDTHKKQKDYIRITFILFMLAMFYIISVFGKYKWIILFSIILAMADVYLTHQVFFKTKHNKKIFEISVIPNEFMKRFKKNWWVYMALFDILIFAGMFIIKETHLINFLIGVQSMIVLSNLAIYIQLKTLKK